ncbi:MAG: sigma-54-dependent Fis family transcriptional regulator [Candidatus Binataceae bacterium]|nr:sigma-54-dependent Fis family transcriptional regulator [Candidatus Binataceae bacterium]
MNSNGATILVVDDDVEMGDAICELLRQNNHSAAGVSSGAAALEFIKQNEPDLLITDLRMSGLGGGDLQLQLKTSAPQLPVIVITAFGSIQTAVESMKLGAFDYITKPFENDEFLLVVARALETRELHREIGRLRGELARNYGLPNIIAANPKMVAALEVAQQVADSAASVLIGGESGTGKDLIARALHFSSSRRDGPFIPVNCAAIPENLIESELFGYVKGAFTDARQGKAGLFVAAEGGTLFLDEIGEMPISLQPKLLRTLEDKRVRPLGATNEIAVNVRIVAATNSDLETAIAHGRFRSDLYYRLATVTIAVPPLRDRNEDIPLLIKYFLARAAAEAGKPIPEIEPDALALLLRYRWPGNVRELQNAVQRGTILCRDNRITVRELPPRIAGDGVPTLNVLEDLATQRVTLDQLERNYIRAVLDSVSGNKTETASILQIDRKTLYRKLEDSPEAAIPDPPGKPGK